MSQPVRIPADVDREDRVIGPLTVRQLLILAVTGIVLYGSYTLTRAFVPLAVFLVVAIPVGVTAAFLALGQRDGISLDRLVLAALRQRVSPQHRVAAPEGIRPAPEWLGDTAEVSPAALQLPAEAVTDTGVVDLGKDGIVVVAVCSTINFSLRTPAEQESLVASFGRYLHSLTAPVQVLVRTERLDLSRQISELREQADGLPHPALERAAREHAEYLDQLGRATDLLRRQVLLILREPLLSIRPTNGLGGASPLAALAARRKAAKQADMVDDASRRAAEARLVRRLGEAVELLSPSGIVVTPLDAGQATAVLAAACNPDSLIPPNSGLAGSDDVITTAPDDGWDDTAFGRTAFAAEDVGSTWDEAEDPDDYDNAAGRYGR
ncbi:PrgI family mobile element protein [Amycolatopsis sp. NPDC051102]|uniref:PrgI family mobile element protein n=1 Tax=Amycolatopsis sp. NPDC051102 TaxID=3155163 RepID=UPI003427B934